MKEKKERKKFENAKQKFSTKVIHFQVSTFRLSDLKKYHFLSIEQSEDNIVKVEIKLKDLYERYEQWFNKHNYQLSDYPYTDFEKNKNLQKTIFVKRRSRIVGLSMLPDAQQKNSKTTRFGKKVKSWQGCHLVGTEGTEGTPPTQLGSTHEQIKLSESGSKRSAPSGASVPYEAFWEHNIHEFWPSHDHNTIFATQKNT